jgi:cobalt-zinc-cadmium efflux system outer membrane protein
VLRVSLVCLVVAAALSSRADELNWNDPQSVARAAADVSPSLLELKSEIAAARERVTSAGSLPNPILMTGVENQQVDLSIDRQMTMYTAGLSQTITRRSRRQALRTVAELAVEKLEHQYEARRAEIERDVLQAYYDASAAQSQLAATEEVGTLAGTIAQSARIRYETGAVPQSDMIRAKLQQSDVKHQALALRARRAEAVAKLAALLNLASDANVPLFANAMKHEHGAQEEPATVPVTTPAIAALEVDVRSADEEIALAKLTGKPDWNVEASYGIRPYEKDTISVVGRIELPLRKNTTIEPRIREAMARREAASRQIAVLRQQLRQDLGIAAARRAEARDQIELHLSELVPQAKLGFESALSSYAAGKETFESTLSSLQSYLALNIDYYDFLRQEQQAEAEIVALRHGARSAGRQDAAIGGMR